MVLTLEYWSYQDRELNWGQDCLSLLCSRFDIWTLLRRFSLRNSNIKKFSFFSKSITNLLSWSTGGIHGIFLSFKNVFNIDQ